MKKLFTVLLLLMTVLIFAACGSSTSATSATTGNAEENESSDAAVSDTITDGDCTAQILDCVPATDANGSSAVAISCQFTNNGADPIDFNTAFYVTVYQNDIEQNKDEVYFGDGYDWDTATTSVKNGASITIYTEVPVSSTTDPVEVVVSGSSGSDSASKTFNLQ